MSNFKAAFKMNQKRVAIVQMFDEIARTVPLSSKGFFRNGNQMRSLTGRLEVNMIEAGFTKEEARKISQEWFGSRRDSNWK